MDPHGTARTPGDANGEARPVIGRPRTRRRAGLVAALVAAMVATLLPVCWSPLGAAPARRGPLGPAPLERSVYRASVVRTPYGIPHVRAADWGSLGYGYGYAFSQDNFCELAKDVVRANGELSRWFGPGGGNLNSDFFFQRIKDSGEVEDVISQPESQGGPSPTSRALVRGFAAGYDRYLRDVGGAAGIDDPRCRGAAWVRPIDELDLWRTYHRTAMLAGSLALLDNIVAAQPPAPAPLASPGASAPVVATPGDPAGGAGGAAGAGDPGPLALPSLPGSDAFDLGSNAIALGRDATAGRSGMVLANPHFPWDGPQRFYEAHLTIPGTYDMIGVSLFANPVIEIGHNDRVAWTHTVSTARRFTFYELKLVPGDPTSYYYDGQVRKMTSRTVTVQVKQPDGSLKPASHTFWSSHEGPMLVVPPLTWGTGTAFTLRDVNERVVSTFDGYIAMGRSRSVRGLQEAIGRYQGLPWINTIAADSSGTAYYADNSIVPNVTDAHFQECSTPLSAIALAQAGVFILDGSRSACEWGNDPDAVRPGIFGPSHLPQLFRSDYVTNSNDSYWLSNPEQPLTGFSRIIGDEGTARSLRTRLGLRLVADRLDGSDGLGGNRFTRDQLQTVMFDNRVYGAELVRDSLVDLCRAHPTVEVDGRTVDLRQACDVLAAWDMRANLDSRGEPIFREFAGFGGIRFKVPFDVDDAVDTPNTLDPSNPAVLQALGRAVLRLTDAGVPLDAPLGRLQTEPRGSEIIPIHGGTGNEGAFNVISARFAGAAGYPDVEFGSSFVMVAELGRRGPQSRAVLTYSQSTDPTSPHYADQTRLYSRKQWVDLPYRPGDVARQAVSRTHLVERRR